MKLYQTPGGAWSKSEAQWAKDMKAEGRDPKKYEGRKHIDVPVKADPLMEFLTFHNVNVIEPAGGGMPPPPSAEPATAPQPPTDKPSADKTLEEQLLALPLRRQTEVVVAWIDSIEKRFP